MVTVGRFKRSQFGGAVLTWFLVVLLTPQLIAMPDCTAVGEHHQPYQPINSPRPGTGRVCWRQAPEGTAAGSHSCLGAGGQEREEMKEGRKG